MVQDLLVLDCERFIIKYDFKFEKKIRKNQKKNYK